MVAVIEAAFSAKLEGNTMVASAGPEGGMGMIVVIVSIEDRLAIRGYNVCHVRLPSHWLIRG